MAINENRIPFDVRDYSHSSHDEFDIDEFQFTESEHKYLPNFVDMGDAYIHVEVLNAISMMTLTLTLEGACHLKDEHDGSIIEYELEDSVDVIIAPESEEDNDIEPDEDGVYDLRGSILALLFDAIPKNYSETPLESYQKDNYTVMSQEEYMASKSHAPSAFDDLDLDDYPDQED
jgi:hypothetical protein